MTEILCGNPPGGERRLRIVVLGAMGRHPYGGQVWLYLNWLSGLAGLGHDVDAGERLGIPVRGITAGIRYSGDFYGQSDTGQPLPDRITIDAFTAIVGALALGITELGCHPADGDVHDVDTTYRDERVVELATLGDGRARAAVDDAGIRLVSFADLVP